MPESESILRIILTEEQQGGTSKDISPGPKVDQPDITPISSPEPETVKQPVDAGAKPGPTELEPGPTLKRPELPEVKEPILVELEPPRPVLEPTPQPTSQPVPEPAPEPTRVIPEPTLVTSEPKLSAPIEPEPIPTRPPAPVEAGAKPGPTPIEYERTPILEGLSPPPEDIRPERIGEERHYWSGDSLSTRIDAGQKTGPTPIKPPKPQEASPFKDLTKNIGQTGLQAGSSLVAGAIGASTGSTILGGIGGLAVVKLGPLAMTPLGQAIGILTVATIGVTQAFKSLHTSVSNAAASIEDLSPDVTVARAMGEVQMLEAMMRRESKLGEELGRATSLRADIATSLADIKTNLLEIGVGPLRTIMETISLSSFGWEKITEYLASVNENMNQIQKDMIDTLPEGVQALIRLVKTLTAMKELIERYEGAGTSLFTSEAKAFFNPATIPDLGIPDPTHIPIIRRVSPRP